MALPLRPRAVITGAAGGLGRAFALALAPRHGRLVLADIDEAGLAETARKVQFAGGEAVTTRCDVADREQVAALASVVTEAFGGVDLLINNAGVACGGPVGDVPLEDWEWVININLWGVIYGCHTFAPIFRKQGRGAIINVASAAGLLTAPQMGPYNVTKSAVVALSETMAAELRSAGVDVTVLCPMFFRTNINQSSRTTLEDRKPLDRIEKLMDVTRVQAADVAQHALDAVERGELYAVPHRSGRWAWRTKRVIPQFFHRTFLGTLNRFSGK